ncbi:hypothetical protein XI06_15100 [Bradyrhizobium sp. CCBAU 11434]|uniref:hypothetical protein n=1 Tax=Bradyrhizobium sp. CCBAU 11434 TaxID=1630885 RepID=UPI002306D785|nr:hypothetical protein [Bradyrhizobium sp. CCBAU 11434]MDA9521635.1 hypothetical protein [Bradyrhizobium sp. CCBAU 11434]
MTAPFNKFNSTVDALSKKLLNLSSDTMKVVFTNAAPVATNVAYTDLTSEVANGNGYTTGGLATTPTLSNSSGTEKLVCVNVTLTATGAVGPFRYVVLIDATATGHELIGWWDYGSSISLANGDTFTVSFDATNGVLTIA